MSRPREAWDLAEAQQRSHMLAFQSRSQGGLQRAVVLQALGGDRGRSANASKQSGSSSGAARLRMDEAEVAGSTSGAPLGPPTGGYDSSLLRFKGQDSGANKRPRVDDPPPAPLRTTDTARLEQKVADLQKQLADAKERSQSKDSDMASLQSQVDLQNREKRKLEGQVRGLEERLRAEQTTNTQQARDIIAMGERVEKAKGELSKFKAEAGKEETRLKKKVQEAETARAEEVLALQARNAELLAQVATLQAAARPPSPVPVPVPAQPDVKPVLIADPSLVKAAVAKELDKMLPTYESLFWSLQNVKGKGDAEAKKLTKARELVVGLELLNKRLEEKEERLRERRER